jgi:hypothetical protein
MCDASEERRTSPMATVEDLAVRRLLQLPAPLLAAAFTHPYESRYMLPARHFTF